MIPANFDYVAAKSLDEAVSLLAKHKDDAKLLAGGHSLLARHEASLRATLAPHRHQQDQRPCLHQGRRWQVHIGSMTTHFQIETSDLLHRICPLLTETAAQLAICRSVTKGRLAEAWPTLIRQPIGPQQSSLSMQK